MEVRCGGLLFTSNFDSGNLGHVEHVISESKTEPVPNDLMKPDYEFNVWTKCDCAGQPGENPNRSWFYFGVSGAAPGKLIKINIMNLNRQGKLYSQGFTPITRTIPGKPKWDRIREKVTFETVENSLVLHFCHRFLDVRGAVTYFAFCYPWSYSECQERLTALDQQYAYCRDATFMSRNSNAIYFHRELLCLSLEQRRVDLITISDCNGLGPEEPRFDSHLFPDHSVSRCRSFPKKKVYMVSSRVHPGETPGSFVFNGFLNFILNESDDRARQLRAQFVFKLIPLLNPDGVARGHYRTDTRGVNLNRVYLNPSFDLHPSIYAAKSLLVYHHIKNRLQRPKDVNMPVNSALPETPTSASTSDAAAANNCWASVVNKDASMAELDKLFENVSRPKMNSSSRSDFGSVVQPAAVTTRNEQLSTITNALTFPPYEDVMLLPPTMSAIQNKYSESTFGATFRNDLTNTLTRRNNLGSIDDDEIASGGECENFDEIVEHYRGNEGSDDDDIEGGGTADNGAVYAPHLCDARLKLISPQESGIACYVDLHGHASKKGCFIYGNHIEDETTQVENVLFPKLVALNSAHFDFMACNFTERNMFMKDKRDGQSKEGAGRVAMYTTLGIVHSYTLECNYNTGRQTNTLAPSCGDNGRCSPPPSFGFPPRFVPAHWEEVGKGLAVAALDLTETNPWSRLTLSEYVNLTGVREWVRRYLRGLNQLPRGLPNKSLLAASKAGYSAGTSHVNRVTAVGPRYAKSSAAVASNSSVDTATNKYLLSNSSVDTSSNKRLPLYTVRPVDSLRKEVVLSADTNNGTTQTNTKAMSVSMSASMSASMSVATSLMSSMSMTTMRTAPTVMSTTTVGSNSSVGISEPQAYPLKRVSVFEKMPLKTTQRPLKHSHSLPVPLVSMSKSQAISLQGIPGESLSNNDTEFLKPFEEETTHLISQPSASRQIYQHVYYPLLREKSLPKDGSLPEALTVTKEPSRERSNSLKPKNIRTTTNDNLISNNLTQYSSATNYMGPLTSATHIDAWSSSSPADTVKQLALVKVNSDAAASIALNAAFQATSTSRTQFLQPKSPPILTQPKPPPLLSSAFPSSIAPVSKKSEKGIVSNSRVRRSSSYSPMMVPRNNTRAGGSKTDTELDRGTTRKGHRRKTSVTSKGIISGPVPMENKNEDDPMYNETTRDHLDREHLDSRLKEDNRPKDTSSKLVTTAGSQSQLLTSATAATDLDSSVGTQQVQAPEFFPTAKSKKGRKKKLRLHKKKAHQAVRLKAMQALAETTTLNTASNDQAATSSTSGASFWIEF